MREAVKHYTGYEITDEIIRKINLIELKRIKEGITYIKSEPIKTLRDLCKIHGTFPKEENVFASPCDGLLSIYQIHDQTVLPVKQSRYTIPGLLQDQELADRFTDGFCLVFRLCVNHYHRYSYFDSGTKGENIRIPGILHTVRPVALAQIPDRKSVV